MSRASTSRIVDADRLLNAAATTIGPGSYATNAPSASITPLPCMAHVGVRPLTSPDDERARAVNLTTSPVRTFGRAGAIVTDVIVFGTTCTLTVAFAVPAVAVSVARPAATAVTRPFSARTMRGALDVHSMGSIARSLAGE